MLLLVYKSKKIELSEITKPKIIRGADFALLILVSATSWVKDDSFDFFLFRKLEKGLFTTN